MSAILEEMIFQDLPRILILVAKYLASCFSEFFIPSKKARPLTLIIMGAIPFVFLYWINGFSTLGECLLEGNNSSCLRITSIKEIIIPLLVILPTFFLWAWRNQDKKEEIENQQVTNNQANFHKLVEWLGGKDETLQLAAVPQFLSFIKGEKGEEFTLPALETIMARLKIWAEEPAIQKNLEDIKIYYAKEPQIDSPSRPNIPLVISRLHQLIQDNGKVLQNFNLSKIQLPFANLTWADLSGANLSWARLTEVDLSAAMLKGTNLRRADLNGADLEQAKLNGANLNGAKLHKADLRGTTFIEANLRTANLNEAYLEEAILTGADLTRANLKEANLTGTNLRGAKLTAAVLTEANIEWANLNEADLTRAVFIGADLTGATLKGAFLAKTHFKGAKYNSDTVWPEGFDPEDPRHGLVNTDEREEE